MAVAIGIGACAPHAGAAQLQLSAGAEYSSGNYGETVATQATVLPFSMKVRIGALSLRASIPYIEVRGPADISPVIDDSGGDRGSSSGSGSGSDRSGSSGSGGSDDGGGEIDSPIAPDRVVKGLGDASVSAIWSFSDLAGSPLYIDVSARARLPTGSLSKHLGIGATDYAAQTEIGWDGRRGGVFISGGRRFLEQLRGSPRRDGWEASAGYWRNIGQRSVFGMQGNWRQSAVAAAADPQSVDAYLTRRLSTGWKLEVTGSAGLSKASPDYAAGLAFIWRSSASR